MFTDIVGSTERASALGDRRWKALVSRHNAIVRRLLKRYGGRELDTAGDGFFVMFDRPAPAIDCAWAIIDALHPLDIQVRAAIHMGEVEVMGSKVGGIAVHVASRLLSLSKPGAIYVTGIVHDVVAGSDIGFVDQGTHELRGVPGEWRLFVVEQPATDRALPLEEPAALTARRRARTPLAVALAIGALVGAGALVLVVASSPSSRPPEPRPNSIVRLDSTGRLALAVPIGDPTGVALDSGFPWVLSQGRRTVSRVDPRTGTAGPVGLPATPTGIAAGEGAIWITTGFGSSAGSPGVVRISGENRTVSDPIPIGAGAHGITVGEGAVWVTNRLANTVIRIDAQTYTVTGEGEVGEQPVAVVADGSAVWVANATSRTVSRVDPGTLGVTGEVTLAGEPHDLASGFGRLWISSTLDDAVYVVDTSTLALLQTIQVGGQPRGIAVGSDSVWVATGNGAVVRIDPNATGDVERIELAGAPEDVAIADGVVWVSLRE